MDEEIKEIIYDHDVDREEAQEILEISEELGVEIDDAVEIYECL